MCQSSAGAWNTMETMNAKIEKIDGLVNKY